MRIEGISEGSPSQLAGHAFAQHAPVRAPSQRAVRPAQGASDRATDVVDVHDSAVSPAARTEVEYKAPYRVVGIGAEQQGVIDRDGDGMITLSDLPFDYFQILRQSNRRPITLPAVEIPL